MLVTASKYNFIDFVALYPSCWQKRVRRSEKYGLTGQCWSMHYPIGDGPSERMCLMDPSGLVHATD